jgi:hypothetical protein
LIINFTQKINLNCRKIIQIFFKTLLIFAPRDFTKRKEAIIEALIARANAICDAHLRVSTEEVPKIFRQGLHYEPEATAEKPKDEKKGNGNGEEEEEKLEVTQEDEEESNVEKEEEANEEEKDGAETKTKEEEDNMAKNPSESDLEVILILLFY